MIFFIKIQHPAQVLCYLLKIEGVGNEDRIKLETQSRNMSLDFIYAIYQHNCQAEVPEPNRKVQNSAVFLVQTISSLWSRLA